MTGVASGEEYEAELYPGTKVRDNDDLNKIIAQIYNTSELFSLDATQPLINIVTGKICFHGCEIVSPVDSNRWP
jgi:hypothetical protein